MSIASKISALSQQPTSTFAPTGEHLIPIRMDISQTSPKFQRPIVFHAISVLAQPTTIFIKNTYQQPSGSRKLLTSPMQTVSKTPEPLQKLRCVFANVDSAAADVSQSNYNSHIVEC